MTSEMEKHKNQQIVHNQLDQLRNEWETFERDELAPVELKLTQILGKCKTLADKFRNGDYDKEHLNEALTNRNIGYNSSSTVYHKVIRLVVQGDSSSSTRSAVTKYAKVLRIAEANEVSGEELEQWICEKGGN